MIDITKGFIKTLKLLLPYLICTRESKIALLITTILVTAKVIANYFAPIYTSLIFSSNFSFDIQIGLVFVLLLCWMGQYITDHLSSIVFYVISNHAIRSVRERVVNHAMSLDWSDTSLKKSEIIHANERVPVAVIGFMNSAFLVIIPAVITIFFTGSGGLGEIVYGEIYLVLVGISFVPVLLLLTKFIKSRIKVWSAGDSVRVVQNESLHNASSTDRGHFIDDEKLSRTFDYEEAVWFKNNRQNFLIHVYQDGLIFFFTAGFMLYLFFLKNTNRCSMSKIIEFSSFSFIVSRNVTLITQNIKLLLTSIIDLERIVSLLEMDSKIYDRKSEFGVVMDMNCKELLIARDICLRYGKKEILRDCSLKINSGDRIVISGNSGSGKSSLCKILAGVINGTSGTIEYGVGLESVRYIGQDSTLLDGTIEENLGCREDSWSGSLSRYFRGRGGEFVGEYGHRLSPGERQRILIFRAIYSGVRVLILDEALNALDERSASEILNEVFERVESVVIVTHQSDILSKVPIMYELTSTGIERKK